MVDTNRRFQHVRAAHPHQFSPEPASPPRPRPAPSPPRGVNVVGDNASKSAAAYAWLPPFFATVVYVMINTMHWSELSTATGYGADPSTATKARLFLFTALLILFASIVGAAFMMVQRFTTVAGAYNEAGASVLISTLLISAAAFLQRFATLPPSAPSY